MMQSGSQAHKIDHGERGERDEERADDIHGSLPYGCIDDRSDRRRRRDRATDQRSGIAADLVCTFEGT